MVVEEVVTSVVWLSVVAEVLVVEILVQVVESQEQVT